MSTLFHSVDMSMCSVFLFPHFAPLFVCMFVRPSEC